MQPIWGTGPSAMNRLRVLISFRRPSYLVEGCGPVPFAEALPGEPVREAGVAGDQAEPADGVVRGFQLEEEQAPQGTLERLARRRAPEVHLPEPSRGQVPEPVGVGDCEIATHRLVDGSRGEVVAAFLRVGAGKPCPAELRSCLVNPPGRAEHFRGWRSVRYAVRPGNSALQVGAGWLPGGVAQGARAQWNESGGCKLHAAVAAESATLPDTLQ
jgi:hypothetical protein